MISHFAALQFLLSENCLVISLELFNTCICQRMLCHLLNNFIWNGSNICGVTTNPSLIAKEGKVFEEVIAEIASIVDGPISGDT